MKKQHLSFTAKSIRRMLFACTLMLLPSMASAQCPDNNHPHMIDLGLSSGVKISCCNYGTTNPEEAGSSYSWSDANNLDLGGKRLLTEREISELVRNCGHEATTQNGVAGQKITGANGNSIFMPLGDYWSCTQNPNLEENAYYMYVKENIVQWANTSKEETKLVRPVTDVSSNIDFADAAVKALCVQNWDTNGDGELSYAEAEAVTDLGTVFKEKSEINSFNELQYFTGLTEIGNIAFMSCTHLTSVVIPNSVVSIDSQAFYYCLELESVTIPNSVTTIGYGAFMDCHSLSSVILPNGLITIGSGVFSSCFGLVSITIPNSVKTIEDYAFQGCRSLASVTIPNSVNSFSGTAFHGCISLKSIDVAEDNPTYTSQNGIVFTKDMTTIVRYPAGISNDSYTIPNSVTSIGKSAFCCSKNLTNIEIPNSVVEIGWNAFESCTALTSVLLPNTLNTINMYAFENCSSLSSIIIPSSVTYIGEEAFIDCTNLKEITFMSCIQSMGEVIIYGCTNLEKVVIYDENPTAVKERTFWLDWNGPATTATLYVPAGTKALYEATEGWNIFENIVEMGGNEMVIPDEAIDLGLPSGTRWAPWNVGASKPEDYGGYYAWGETVTKDYYSFENYSLCDDGDYLSCHDIGSNISGTEYDAAFVNWGKNWRMPTNDEMDELFACDKQWTTMNGVEGILITGPNGNTLFLSAAGWYNGSYSHAEFTGIDFSGDYWTSTLYPTQNYNAYSRYFYRVNEELETRATNQNRKMGLPVRPVYVESSTSDIAIDAANFPDENFRNYLLEQDYGQDGILTQDEIDRVTTVSVTRMDIADLKGIEHFTALEELRCGWNHLTTLNVSKNNALIELECSSNQLSSLDVSNNTALKSLYCYINQLTSLDVSQNTELTNLSCSSNQLTELNVSNNTKIWELDCSENNLSSLDVSKNVMLSQFACFGNNLTSLDVSNHSKLWTCGCDHNQLISLNVSNCALLQYLYCSDNQLTSLDVLGNTALSVIECSNNFIKGASMDELIAGLSENGGSLRALKPNEGNEHNIVTNSQVAAANAKGWKVYQYDGSVSDWVELEVLEPVADGEQDFGAGGDITEETVLNGVVVDNMFYNIGTDAGGYNSEEGCIVITQETSDEQMELLQGLGISDEELQQNFTGIIFKVPAGKGAVTVTAETTGSMTLKVKVGNGQAVEMELSGRLKMTFPYDVSEESLVYIYAGTTGVSGARRSAEESSLKIYGIEWTSTSMPGDADGDGTIDVNDITCVAAHILGRNPANFNAAAADADGDGTIDVNDITVIAGMILNSGK